MNGYITKLYLLSAALMSGCASVNEPMIASAQPPTHSAAHNWEKIAYKKIGLAIEIPNWNADIEEHNNLWTLFGYPLVDNPITDTQYCVTIQIRKMAEKTFRLSLAEEKDQGKDLQTWINLSHRTTSRQADPYWIYIRRDIFTDDGFVYRVSAKIKRVGEKWEFNVKDRVKDYQVIADETRRVIDSIIPHNETQDL